MRQPEWMAILHPTLGIGFVDLLQVLTTAFGTKLPFPAFKTTSAFWGTPADKCSLRVLRILT